MTIRSGYLLAMVFLASGCGSEKSASKKLEALRAEVEQLQRTLRHQGDEIAALRLGRAASAPASRPRSDAELRVDRDRIAFERRKVELEAERQRAKAEEERELLRTGAWKEMLDSIEKRR